ncbi:MAG TPA: hypothetical protein VEK84_07665 [Terriglobales bacterium]|nr:hypothetical protein [Terriglobales bacterium]
MNGHWPGTTRIPCSWQNAMAFGLDGALARPPVHPHPPYARLGAIVHNGFGDFRGSHQQRCFDGRLDVLQASEASPPLHLRRVGIYGNHVIPMATEFFEQFYAEICRISRDPSHRDTFLSQEILNGFQ